MSRSAPPSLDGIGAFLSEWHGSQVRSLEPLDGGFWSSAFGYGVNDDDFVFRLSDSREGFDADRAAHRFSTPLLPVPEVLDVGDAFDRSYAISRRAYGSFLEDVDPGVAARSGPTVSQLLRSLRAVPQTTDASVLWHEADNAGTLAWRDWIRSHLVDDPERTVSGWRRVIAADPELDAAWGEAERTILDLLEHCPERRDLVHGDLLHQNVLISPDASKVTAVFSWKCSVLGDHLYDVAWLSFWEPWHPGIERIDVWSHYSTGPIEGDDSGDAAIRHHCYEVLVGAQHLAWCAWTGNRTELDAVARRTLHVLRRGPRID